MMYISFPGKIHRSTITTVARPQLAGSVEPATRAKQHYITGYIQWHYAIYRFTDFFSFLEFAWFINVKTCQINAPKWPAKISCRENLLDSPARIIHWICSPEKSAISTRGLLARDPPFPAQNPQARPGPPTLPPPPPTAPPTEQGGGGRELARPTHAYWTGTFPFFPHFVNGYIFLYNTIHTYSTQCGLNEI